LEPSQRCNAACGFCYHHEEKAEGGELTLDEIRTLLKDAWALGCRVFYLSGGEPTIHPRLLEILEEAHAVGYRTSLTTNGSRLASVLPRVARLVEGVTVSIDHPGEEHDRIRRLPGLYASAVAGLVEAERLGVPSRINMSLGTLNRDQVPGMIALAGSVGAGLHVRLLTRESTAMDVPSLAPADARAAAHELLELKREHPRVLITPAAYFRRIADAEPFQCRLLSLLVNVDSSGRVYVPCPRWEGTKQRVAGSIRKHPLPVIWWSREAGRIREEAAACRPRPDCYTSCVLDISLLAGLDASMLLEQVLAAGSLFRYFWRRP
jgi:MoaA/NifB/PqqE/SkfB family radical SAM enzyme